MRVAADALGVCLGDVFVAAAPGLKAAYASFVEAKDDFDAAGLMKQLQQPEGAGAEFMQAARPPASRFLRRPLSTPSAHA